MDDRSGGKQRALWVEISPLRDDVEEEEGDGTVLKGVGGARAGFSVQVEEK